VPTVAIENVWISVNTSIIQDEVLAHRIGLVPIKVDPSMFDFVQGEEETDSDTVVFHLDYVCGPAPNADEDHSYTESLLSSHLNWVPQGNQSERFPGTWILS
jgi:DNA-directed RNA polymerase I and III subunit RPAC1